MKRLIFLFSIFFTSVVFSDSSLYFFWGKGCSHCKQEKIFLEKLQKKYKYLKIHSFEVWNNKKNRDLLIEIGKKMDINISAVPITIVGKQYFIGFLNDTSTGSDIEKAVINYKNGEDLIKKIIEKKTIVSPYQKGKTSIPDKVKLPLFGEVSVKEMSLPVLTIVLGLVDGFNPCAMWALLMLISFLIGIKNRKKMFLLGSIFIVISAFVYFMFMIAWLNFLFFFRYIQWIKTSIALIALFGGAFYIKEFFKNKKGECKVSSQKYKKYISDKLAFFTQKKMYLAILGIIFLAFSVNLIELICSMGLPVVYLQVLSMSDLSNLQYYLYILLYIFIFMMDDLFIFLLAMLSLEVVGLTSKYSRYSHLIGGILLLLIGSILLIKPDLLMF